MIQLRQLVNFSIQKTYILPFSSSTFLSELQRVTKPYGETPNRKKDFLNYHFTGKITPTTFQITRTVAEPNNFLFIAQGSVESSSKGCIIFVRFKMFAFTKFLMIFFGLLGLLATLFLLVHEQNWLYGGVTGVFTCIHTLVCLLNLKRQHQLVQTMLEEFINSLSFVV